MSNIRDFILIAAFVLVVMAALHAFYSMLRPIEWLCDLVSRRRRLPLWKRILAVGLGLAFGVFVIYVVVSRVIPYVVGD
jgi:hypothetical protein